MVEDHGTELDVMVWRLVTAAATGGIEPPMHRLLRLVSDAVAGRPLTVVAAIVVLTLVLGAFATQAQTDNGMTAFSPDSTEQRRLSVVQEEFGQQSKRVQIIVYAGEGGDVLSPEGLAAATRIEELIWATPGAEGVLDIDGDRRAVVSFATHMITGLTRSGLEPASTDAATVDAVAARILSDPDYGAAAGALYSSDLDAKTASAEGGLVVARISTSAHRADIRAYIDSLNGALTAEDFGEVEVSRFSAGLLSSVTMGGGFKELPLLLGLALLLVSAILYLTYRNIGDVLIAIVGLIVSIVWMYGIAVLLGPDYLGVTGALTSIAIAAPVLVVGLGVDYAIHLTSRFKEERRKGSGPSPAAVAAVLTVGGALVLATATTIVSFLTNIASPLPPIRDFGVFAAVGVLSAFIVMITLVPSVRVLRDRRTARNDDRHDPQPASRRSGRVAAVMGRVAMLAERRPKTTVAVALVIAITAGIAGSRVSTTFSQTDFLPQDSEVVTTLERMEGLFGGDLNERTYILLEGDLGTPEAEAAMLEVESALSSVDGVRTTADRAQVRSPASVADPAARASVITEGGQTGVMIVTTTAGQEGATALALDIKNVLEPLEAAGIGAVVVSTNLVMAQTMDALTSSQAQSIAVTLVAALLLLVAYFGWRERRPILGVVTMLPSVFVVALVLGSMYVLGLSFNVLTAMVASLAIGIGVPYGIHVTYRFLEEQRENDDVDQAIRVTIEHTGTALLGSAATTAAGFGVLAFSSLVPLQQFGAIAALTIVYSFVVAVAVQPAALKLWAGPKREETTVPETAAVKAN